MKTDPKLRNLIILLKKQKKAFWLRIAQLLARPKSKTAEVNFEKLNKMTSANETVIVPGKLLGTGKLEHPLTIAVFSVSNKAKNEKNAKLISIEQLLKNNLQGKNIKIII
ncbi:50S ribosomal protein L18e [Candidatus Pacearchaeota archaeon CG06_land_8_20_14_3_00_35_12]|nr:MAG: 50S ribosomal protein L18e [Candidatus Pacearchaeota archaeon CG06_land_8_20_14_3_00_35_12]